MALTHTPDSDPPQAVPDAAIADWRDALMQADARELPTLWRQIDADPALQDAEVQEQLSQALLDALTEAPDDRLALYTDGAQRFGWERISASRRTLRPMSMFVYALERQGEIHAAYPPALRRDLEETLRQVRRVKRPRWWNAYTHAADLQRMQRELPQWLALRLPAGRLDAMLAAAEATPGLFRLPLRLFWPVRYWFVATVGFVALLGVLHLQDGAGIGAPAVVTPATVTPAGG